MKINTDGIRNRIYEERKKLEFSQDYMAFQLGMTQRNYSMIENGEISLRVEELAQIATVLQVTLDDLLKGV